MAKIPDQPQRHFCSFNPGLRQAFGKDLVSLMLYGSAAGGSYVKGKSI